MSGFLVRSIVAVVLLLSALPQARAFSLLGQKLSWHILRLGHADGQIGGPVGLGEEHRWNVPVIYYSLSPEFLQFFGARGEEEIQKCMKILMDLPAMSTLNVDDYPLSSVRVNFRAQALGLLDIKSVALAVMLEELGLGDPTQYVFTLRKRWTPSVGGTTLTNYYIIKRNFDPVTYEPSSYINGELWTFRGIGEGDTSSIVARSPANPLSRNMPVASGFPPSGAFYTGLTRDDVGGLKYIYSYYNVNLENASSNSFSLVGAGGVTSFAGVAGINSPWAPVAFQTNTLGGTTDPTGGLGTGTGTGTGTGVGGTGTNAFVNTALRPGIDKLQFQRLDFDSILGVWVTTNFAYTDFYLQNGAARKQLLARPMPVPDVVFHTADLAGDPTSDETQGFFSLARTDQFFSFATLNDFVGSSGAAGGGTGGTTFEGGPGVINPGVTITFNNLQPYFYGGPYPSGISEFTASRTFAWGSFDGSTNAPVTYPSGASIEELERRLFGR